MVCVGIITGARGLQGELWVRSFTADPGDVAAYGPLTDSAGGRSLHLRVLEVDAAKGRVRARVDGIGDRSGADALKGVRLFVPRSRLPEPEDEEYYHADLIGLPVSAASAEGDAPLGRVTDVHDFGAGPLLEIERDRGGSVLQPFTREAVPVVDLAAGRIVVRLLPGLHDPVSSADADAPYAAADAGGGEP